MVDVGCQEPNATGMEFLLVVVQLRLAGHGASMRLARQERTAKAIQRHNLLHKEPGYISGGRYSSQGGRLRIHNWGVVYFWHGNGLV